MIDTLLLFLCFGEKGGGSVWKIRKRERLRQLVPSGGDGME